jgi:hypothetical protein
MTWNQTIASAWLACNLLNAQNVVVRPKPVDGLIVNPGMGIQTFQRFAGQPIYPGLRWSEVGPESKTSDSTTPVDFPPSSVAYVRWFWHQLEPERGKYRWEIIDSALDEARGHHQTLMFRLMPYDEKDPLPDWYRNSGARRANKPEDKDGKIWSPDASDPLYRSAWSALIRQAGERYDGHPYLDSVDISTVGYWGEGWGPYLPDFAVQQELIDVYFEAFPRTPKLVNFDELRALVYGVKRGAGWRLDCWGDMGRPGKAGFAHMFDLYPEQLARDPSLYDAWRHGPVSLETCGTPLAWKQWGFDLKPILDQALRWHASTINIKSTAIPPEWREQFAEFQKRIGYRFALRRFEHPREARAGSMVPVKMWWQNTGVAPVYRDYALTLEFRSERASARSIVPADVRKWLPGDSVYEGSVYLDSALAPGKYRIRVALLDPRTAAPAIQLAMDGRQPDGWYDVSEIEVK